MLRTIVATGLLACSLSANAIPVTFDLAGAPASSVEVVDFDSDGFLCDFSGCGVSAALNPLLGSLNRTLSAGESWSFNFFNLSFYGFGGGSGAIAASLGFDAPMGAPDANGSGSGGFFTLFGIVSGGHLIWTSQPGVFTLADGSSYSVSFENLYGITVGSTNVSGRITLLQEPGAVNVPEPISLALLGMGLLGLGLARRRKNSV